jgi:hypothetical protein
MTVDTAELTRVLHHEHALLGRLQLATASLRLLLGAGEGRFLATASDEVHDLLDAVAVVEALRAAATADLGAQLGIDHPEPSLAAIVQALPPEQAADLRGLGDALRAAMTELGEVGAEGAGLAEAGLGQLRALLDRAEAEPMRPGYGPVGGWVAAPLSPVRFDVDA